MIATDERAFPVLRDDQMVGMVCLEDVRKVPRDSWSTTLVSQIMTPANKLATASPDEDASEALKELVGRDVNQLPVMRNGRLAGILRRSDILRWLQLHSDERLEA